MSTPYLDAAVERLRSANIAQVDRPDVAAWLLLGRRACEMAEASIVANADRLVRFQLPNGSLPVHPDVPSAHWPTAIAALAWNGLSAYQPRAEAAIRSVMRSTGKHWPRAASSVGHDTAIVGWSWVSETHSWVEPTAISMMAARAVPGPEGLKQMTEERLEAGVRLLLDRQLADGGWNYGNTVVFRNSLKPLPEETAWALTALAPYVDRDDVAHSLDYLDSVRPKIVAPVTLSATMLAWLAWNVMFDAESMVETSLAAQTVGGDYPLAMVAQLIATLRGPELVLGKAV